MSVEPPSANSKYLEHQHCEVAREVYQTLEQSSLDKFTFAFIDSSRNDLEAVIYGLERTPEDVFKELVQVVLGISEAQNELRLARFLFDLEEINPVYRLIMRNRAVLRSKEILRKVLRVWPLYNSSHE